MEILLGTPEILLHELHECVMGFRSVCVHLGKVVSKTSDVLVLLTCFELRKGVGEVSNARVDSY